jgi:hypothetical protein
VGPSIVCELRAFVLRSFQIKAASGEE